MNSNNHDMNEEQLAGLLSSIERDAPPPDRAVLDALRERSTSIFQTETPPSPGKKNMRISNFRWLISIAALLVLGVVFAQWIIKVNKPLPVVQVPDDKFVLQNKLSDDGRIGKVTDAQGVVSIKPVLAERWSPVTPQLVLKPGDWIRTDSRGANATSLKLSNSTLIVGPHSTVELAKPSEIRLIEGELEISATKESPVEVLGPNKTSMKIEEKQFIRIEKEKLVRVAEEPRWLKGFKGTTTNESIGSLIAKVDGRDTPLTVGYHHVTVDIRDQIARTVIEESFVNRTGAVLEGIFYFPLPQDASISGFGMWIGDQLVEADVVEKQRAREIYETILREKRDPGLLEWAGGNIFKARVYPIPAMSEKRIKISYSQVLPLKGNKYRYSYGLQSEMLKQFPLKDLKIDVKVNSAVNLKSVTSPTHDTRLSQTEHSGHIEFSAHEYTPTRDFETVIEVAGRTSDVVVIPHRRGEDGYFMVQLTPPDGVGNWERPLIPNGEPLKLLVLADTSASMDRGQRNTQNALLASLLSTLTPKDQINVAACDVNCDWIFEKPMPATPENVAKIRDVLAKRVSLGWTNLDNAITSAMAMGSPDTHTIYLGDGIVTTGDADPVAFAKRLAKVYEPKSGIFHAITLGSSYEPAAVKAIAAMGGGSWRRVSGEQSPQVLVTELLSEIATPALRNIKVEITGVRTARVYPEELPNVAAGSQQILLGRYLPEGKDQQGEIVVTGMLGSKPVRYTTKFSLKDAELGNSFIPRLWARMHLDKLLEQGTSEAIKQDIIALSEEFNIITPYTSLLVLESDADRERFAVKRRFQMRDGEKFFAQGRDNALFELKQKQMKQAGDYRTALRRKILAQLVNLGRDTRMFQSQDRYEYAKRLSDPQTGSGGWGGELGYLGDGELRQTTFEFGSNGRAFGVDDYYSVDGAYKDAAKSAIDTPQEISPNQPATPLPLLTATPSPEPFYSEGEKLDELKRSEFDEDRKYLGGKFATERSLSMITDMDGSMLTGISDPYGRTNLAIAGEYQMSDKLEAWSEGGRYYRQQAARFPWLGLYPLLNAPAREWKEPKSKWSPEAIALSLSLVRKDKLAQVKGGIAIVRTTEYYNTRLKELGSRSQRFEYISPSAWLVRSNPDNGPITISWCDAKDRGEINTAFQLGRVRASNKFDLTQPPLELSDHSVIPLHLSMAGYIPTIEAIAKDRVLLIVKHKNSPDYETRYLIDTNRHVILSVEARSKGKVVSSSKYDDFIEIAGSWWARKVESFDDKNVRITSIVQTVTAVSAEDHAKNITQELAGKSKVLFLKQPLPGIAEAKAAIAAGKATFDDRTVMVLHFAMSQQWTRCLEHVTECERLTGDKPGMRWLSDSFLMASRKHAEMSKRYSAYAGQLVNAKDPNEYYLAEYVLGQARQVMEANEILAFSDQLKPIYERQPKHLQADKSWRVTRVSLYQQVGQQAKALELSKQLAIDYPQEYWQQYQYAQNLVGTGDYDAAYAWLNRVLEAKWSSTEGDALRSLYTQFLQTQGRYTDLAEYLADWIKLDPEGDSAYSQYLFALVRTNQGKKAEELVAQWLREAQIAGELPRPVVARLQTAVSFAMGQNQYIYSYRVEERWNEPLAQVALFFARHPELNHVSSRILNHHSDANRKVRKTIIDMLMREYQTLPLAEYDRLVMLVWNEISIDDLKKLSADLRKKWDSEKDADKRHVIGQKLLRNLQRTDNDSYVAFVREQYKQATADYRVQYATLLFNTLLSQQWKVENEDEAFAILEQLADPDELAKGMYTKVANLHRLTDAMVNLRYQALMNKVEHQEKLTRPDLQNKQTENLKLAREGYAESLRLQVAKRAKPLAPWLTIERLRFEILLERNFKQVADDCWAFLKTEPVKANPDDDDTQVSARLDNILRSRYRITLTNLATRKNADAELIVKLLKYIDDQLATKPDSDQWRSEKYRLLIALDRSKDIETELKRWINQPNPNPWKLALGSLYAELGQLPEAIKMYEDVEVADELAPTAYRSLSDWYLVENRREQFEKAQATVYKTTDENQLAQRIYAFLRPWQSNHLPTQLDKEVLQVFQVLFQKSAWPQNYLWYLQQFYQASRDFRLLSMLPEAVIGHTPGKVYPFLTSMHTVLNEIRDEATSDEIIAQIVKTRTQTKSVIDHRVLDLLEMLVERRAAELHNQSGPHTDKAVAAFERAFKREWSSGEPRLMADFIHGLGKITQPALAKLQLQYLETLHLDSKVGTMDRLHIAQRYAEILQGDGKNDQAMDLLQAGLKEFEDANNGTLPNSANGALGWYVSITESAKQFERGEKFLLAQLKHPVHNEQKYFLMQRLQQHYLEALRNGGEVSLGKGVALYKVLEKRLMEGLKTPDANHRYQIFLQLSRLYNAANNLKIDGAVKDLQKYAFEFVPALLKAQSTHYDELVRDLASTLHANAGPRDGIRFLLDCAENAPDWQRYTNQDVWQMYNNSLGQWKFETKDLGDLEPRLLKFILTELRRDLRTQQRQFRTFYARHHNYYWSEKASEFAKVAEEVYGERKASGSAVEYIATYMFDGLPMEKRAIEILYIAHREKILSDNGQWLLAVDLQHQKRYAESIPLLVALMERGQDSISYRRKLMYAYYKTDKKVELLDLLKKTDAYFHEKDRWNEHILAELAASTLENQLFAESAKYYDELIPLHQKTHARRGIGNGTLSAYYASASQAYTGLGKTKEAVDMASGAVVSWGPRQDQRKDALNALVNVLASAKDLKAYITELDKEKLQSAVVRKAIGQAYIQKNEHALAIPQLQLAAELQPNDTETYTLLLTCCDKIGDKEKAIEQLYQAVELSRRDIKLYEELGKRLNDNKQTVEGERANTSIVELLPNESESHSALAEIREKQNRWPEAIAHWERVANIRSLEPTGLLKLAAAQIHEKDWKNAGESLRKLRTKTWPQRFTDVEKQTRELEKQLEKSKN